MVGLAPGAEQVTDRLQNAIGVPTAAAGRHGAVTDEGVTVTAVVRDVIRIGCDNVEALVADLLGRGSCGAGD